MFWYLFYLVTVITYVSTKQFHVPVNGSRGIEGRIAGGTRVTKDFEYQVQITIRKVKFCSGAIINKYFILSAAHCLLGVSPSDVEVLAGSYNRGQGKPLPISEIKLHPSYDRPENNFDVAYLKTVKSIPLGRGIREIGLAEEPALPPRITISGWGIQSYNNDKLSDQLMSVELQVLHNSACTLYYPEVGINRNMFCAQRTYDYEKGACKGDGGGPAIEVISQRLYGLSSFTKGCGRGMAPSVFTYLIGPEISQFIFNGTAFED